MYSYTNNSTTYNFLNDINGATKYLTKKFKALYLNNWIVQKTKSLSKCLNCAEISSILVCYWENASIKTSKYGKRNREREQEARNCTVSFDNKLIFESHIADIIYVLPRVTPCMKKDVF